MAPNPVVGYVTSIMTNRVDGMLWMIGFATLTFRNDETPADPRLPDNKLFTTPTIALVDPAWFTSLPPGVTPTMAALDCQDLALPISALFPRCPADFDGDGDVDDEDYAIFEDCSTAPGIPQNDPNCLSPSIDLDGDGDVDQSDFGLFQRY